MTRRTERRPDVAAVVRAMLEAGATFRQTDGGTWIVDNLTSLPAALQDEFYECDERELVRHLRGLEKRDDRAA